MNKLSNRKISFWVLCFFFPILASCSQGRFFAQHIDRPDYKISNEGKKYLASKGIKELPEYDIPIEINERVIYWLEYFQGNGKKHIERYLERSGRYEVMMRTILHQEGVPEDLIYSAMIESGFNTSAYSRAKASGPWQFISSTGKHYGLKHNYWYDERRDPVKSTRAAAQYLSRLYKEFGDWYLALAAYNAGEGKVRRAIRRAGTNDYWELSRKRSNHLRAETKNHIPKILAAAILAKLPDNFGFKDVAYHSPLVYDSVLIDGQVDLKIAARIINENLEEFKILNPELKRGVTPPVKEYELRIPPGKKNEFELAYASLPKTERRSLVAKGGKYKVRSGDVLSIIARRHGVRLTSLIEINGLTYRSLIRPGQTLIIPGGKSKTKKNYRHHTVHVVHKGEAPSTIAHKYGIKTSILMSENNLTRKSLIKVGQKLIIPLKKKPVAPIKRTSNGKHIVKNGEATSIIARKYGLTTSELLSANGLNRNSIIKVGQNLKIPQNYHVHRVVSGESLWAISKKYNVTIDELKGWNGINEKHLLKQGQELVVYKRKRGSPASGNLNVASTEEVMQTSIAKEDYHTVQPGDTLWDIAKKYKTSIASLKAINKLKSNQLRPGDRLTVVE